MTSKLSPLLALLFASACATSEPRVDRISATLCACEAAALGVELTPALRDACHARVAATLERQSDACVSCLDHAVGASSGSAACAATDACACDPDAAGDHIAIGSLETETVGF